MGEGGEWGEGHDVVGVFKVDGGGGRSTGTFFDIA